MFKKLSYHHSLIWQMNDQKLNFLTCFYRAFGQILRSFSFNIGKDPHIFKNDHIVMIM